MSTNMSSRSASTKDVLQDHSQAKVKLYTGYLSAYLKILGNTPYMDTIHLFDILCGEGRYKDGEEGSALQGLRTIIEYYASTPLTKLKLSVRLNDFGQSTVEKGYKKIERVESFASKLVIPKSKIQLTCSDLEYSVILEEVGRKLNTLRGNEKSIVFIDPWGYKSIKPQKLKELFACDRCEILLFLPTTHMYRFANKATASGLEEKVPSGSEPLKRLLEELFDNDVPRFQVFDEFESAILKRLTGKMGAKYSSSFALETAKRNKYSLFFFTPHIKGLDVFNQVRWKLDTASGRGYFYRKNPNQLALLLNCPEVAHIQQVRDLIRSGHVNNRQVYEFGVVNGYLTKATNAALNHLKGAGEVVVEASDGKSIPTKTANYLQHNSDRDVLFKYVDNGAIKH
ncbi:three-Cys-motif partner protein TcmP [Hymenobacter sp. HDW8]|uniref:three-Cys-motif partner protein TcmP n=1 Tax=Hymenobacter sp. HDW8 TaxID=2714932 RepID=UPI0014076463|nr:three-Cys-motif partner protein TcmP [Hymenobacter sp. HDW8]QIL78460.1 three-Cys-motif partner protein TcmP [Hymenobacter sp. HDW8]